MSIAKHLLAEAGSESQRLVAKQKLYKLTGRCEP